MSELCDTSSMRDEERGPLFVEVPEQVAAALQDQNVDLIAMLRDEGHAVERGAMANPTKPPGSKDAALVIVASGAAAYMVGLAVVRIIKAVTGKPVVGTLGELKPVVDDRGHVVRDAQGKPLTYRVGEKQILDPAAQPSQGDTAIKIPSVLEITVKE